MTLTLDEVVQSYLADTDFQQERDRITQEREKTLAPLQRTIASFVAGSLDLHQFRVQLEQTLNAWDDWGALGTGFMMQLNILRKHHDSTSSVAEDKLRSLLNGLEAQNVGPRIEELYKFLSTERERLYKEGKTSRMVANPSHSAFIISLFAIWLDPQGDSIVYYESLRKGLYKLIKADLVPSAEDLHLENNAIQVRTASDHQKYMSIIHFIADNAPQLKLGLAWSERFSLWVEKQVILGPTTALVADRDDTTLLATVPHPPQQVKESAPPYAPVSKEEQADVVSAVIAGSEGDDAARYLSNDPLCALQEPQLQQAIREVQQHILVDERVIRRLYHALLAGHVILTGPPGTGKTVLARTLPEILWKQRAEDDGEEHGGQLTAFPTTPKSNTAYTTRVVTATDEWSVRTLISGIAPQSSNGTVSYAIQYGYLTTTILNNWASDLQSPTQWHLLRRTPFTTPANVDGTQQAFRGQWLVIDEFNRAPIDLALGEALTALSGTEKLRVAIEGGSAELPIPRDFRIIGTLNSFDRNYLNQMSEALKRRFTFVEILPPTRTLRNAEQSVVLYKALSEIKHLCDKISLEEGTTLYWQDVVAIGPDLSRIWSLLWENEQHPFRLAFEAAWHLFEVIRIYRQLGTAQAISFIRHMLIAGLLQDYNTSEEWIGKALDEALCDTLADQLQVLLPDEIEVLLLYLTSERSHFAEAYNALLARRVSTPQRLYGQLLALSNVNNDSGEPFLTDEQVEQIAEQDNPRVDAALLTQLFHLDSPHARLPLFSRRLRAFKAERGL